MTPIQIGQHWAIARKWWGELPGVDIYASQEDDYASIGIYEMASGQLRISIFEFDTTELTIEQARALASLLETAAAIAADWSSWVEGDRCNPSDYDAYLARGGTMGIDEWRNDTMWRSIGEWVEGDRDEH